MQPTSPRPAPSGEAAPNGVERTLAEAVRRLMRQPRGCIALVLQLSGLPAPAPRPHHRRIARALMQDAAQRHDGQVFALGNGDLALLCRLPPELTPQAALDELPATLAKLLQVDMPDPGRLVSLWPLATAAAALHRYVDARIRELRPEGGPRPPTGAPRFVAEPLPALAGVGVELLQRQVSVMLPGRDAALGPALGPTLGHDGIGAGLRPLYRAVGLSRAAMGARRGGMAVEVESGHPGGDPFLLRHLAGQRDPVILEALHAALGGGGPLDAALPGAPPLHVALTLAGIASAGYAAWVDACGERGAAPAIEVAALEAYADIAGFAAARSRVQGAGLPLLVSGISHLTLLLARPWALGADLMLVDWSPRLGDLAPSDAAVVVEAIAGQGAARTLLAHADTEAALRWGVARGIRRFQGRHVDAMLGVARISACVHANGCTLRQCIERATAAEPAGRRLCRDTRLLDAGLLDAGLLDAGLLKSAHAGTAAA